MKLLNLFNYSAEKEFSLELVQRVRRELPPSMLEGQRKDMTVNKITRVLERTYGAAVAYQKEHKLNFIRRAVLANNFKWSLRNNNYTDEFVNVATEGLIISMAKKKVVGVAK